MQIRLQTCLIERVGSYKAKLLCRLVDRYSMHLLINKARHVKSKEVPHHRTVIIKSLNLYIVKLSFIELFF